MSRSRGWTELQALRGQEGLASPEAHLGTKCNGLPQAPSFARARIAEQRQGTQSVEKGLSGATAVFHFSKADRIADHIFRASLHQKELFSLSL